MGKALLAYRLAVRDIRHHAAQAVLLVVAIAAAAATLTMALAMNGVTSHPYAATRAATKGPDVVAYLTSAAQARSLVHASGVRSSSGPYPVAYGTIAFDGRTAAVFAEGRSQAPAAVDQPDVTAGSWVRPGGVVLERTFAEALGARVGDMVTLTGQRFTVAGIAVTAAQPPYPYLCAGYTVPPPGASAGACPPWFNIHTANVDTDDSGQIWMTEADALGLASKANPPTCSTSSSPTQLTRSRSPASITMLLPAIRRISSARCSPPGRGSRPRTHGSSRTRRGRSSRAYSCWRCSRSPAWRSWSGGACRSTRAASGC